MLKIAILFLFRRTLTEQEKTMRVLAIDDSKLYRKAIIDVLSRLNAGGSCILASRAQFDEVLSRGIGHFDAVVLDYHIEPGFTAEEVMELIHQELQRAPRTERLPVIVATSNSSDHDGVVAIEARYEDLIWFHYVGKDTNYKQNLYEALEGFQISLSEN